MGSQALDHAARQMGYKNYDQYAAVQHQQMLARQAPVQAAPAQPVQPQQPPQNWLQTLINATPLGGAMARVRKALP